MTGKGSGARRIGTAKRSLEGGNNTRPQARVLGGPLGSAKGNQPFDSAGGHPRERVMMNVVFARKSAQRTRRRRPQLRLENSKNRIVAGTRTLATGSSGSRLGHSTKVRNEGGKSSGKRAAADMQSRCEGRHGAGLRSADLLFDCVPQGLTMLRAGNHAQLHQAPVPFRTVVFQERRVHTSIKRDR